MRKRSKLISYEFNFACCNLKKFSRSFIKKLPFPIQKAQEVEISKAKDEAISRYKSLFEKELAGSSSYINDSDMINNHARIKKLAIDMVIDVVY